MHTGGEGGKEREIVQVKAPGCRGSVTSMHAGSGRVQSDQAYV